MKTSGAAALLVLTAFPARAAALHLLDDALALRGDPPGAVAATAPAPALAPSPRALLAVAAGGGSEQQGSSTEGEGGKKEPESASPPPPGSLDFDLLGAPAPTKRVDEGALRLRRTMLTWHQGVGLGMFALQLATTAVGQLNYNDKFGGDNTNKYVQPHAILAFSTLAAFAAAGTLALLAPSPIRHDEGFDRVKLHKLAMFTAAAGMVAQGVLGVWTQSREGYLNQQTIATAHLAIGYVTLAAVAAGVSALVF